MEFLHSNCACIFIFIDDLSFKRFADQSKTADGFLYYARNAVDRNISTCMRTVDIGQTVMNIYNSMWWKVDLGGMYSIYSINILFKSYEKKGM